MRRFLILTLTNVTGFIELLLLIRIILKSLSANASALIVSVIYGITDYFIIPVQGIFQNASFQFGVIDVVAITAMVFYFIAFGILFKIISILTGRE